MRKALFLCLILVSFLVFALPVNAETLVTLDEAAIEAASISSPVEVLFNGTCTEFLIVWSAFSDSADNSNVTIIAGNNASDTAMWFSAGDTSGTFYITGGSYNLTSEVFSREEGAGDAYTDTIQNVTFHAGAEEYLAINGTETYNSWGITWASFDFVWLFKQGSGSVWEGTPTVTLDLSSSVYSAYSASEILFALLPTLVSIAVITMVIKQFVRIG